MNKVIHSSTKRWVRVALDVPLQGPFDYWSADISSEDVGRRVTVPFGHQELVGVILALPEDPALDPERIKPIHHIHRDTPPLSSRFLEFLSFAARYYHHPLGQVIAHALPPRLRETKPWSARQNRRVSAPTAEKMLHPQHALTVQQKSLVAHVGEALNKGGFAPFLLHGVTGSGKTEVYFEWMQIILERGQKVLVLVPEINLTPQLEARVGSRFPEVPLINLHSRLSSQARVHAWLKLFEPGPALIIGTRLSILCPAEDLGLIVVDEEHDPSFKQQEGLRYSARDLAVVRAQQWQCALVLGSATPSLESLLQAKRGKYQRLRLTERADPRACLPDIQLIDMRRFPSVNGLTAAAEESLEKTLQRGEQSLVFINRRGYSPVLWCNSCGWFAGCPRCQSKLVFYRRARKALCHLCGYSIPTPKRCPTCGNVDLMAAGEGTERLEDTLQQRFPSARIVRVDTDSMSSDKRFDTLRQALIRHEVDILVGTQMLAKGHDFPNLTTVVVVNPDSALYSTDFRAEERLFAQLTQVAGRAGRRDKPGQVLVQTAHPEHPLFNALLHHDVEGYCDSLLEGRERFRFPPYTFQAKIQAQHRNEDVVCRFLESVHSALKARHCQGVTLYDPVPSSPPKIALKYRYQWLIQAEQRAYLHPAISVLMALLEQENTHRVQWSLDIDPQEV